MDYLRTVLIDGSTKPYFLLEIDILSSYAKIEIECRGMYLRAPSLNSDVQWLRMMTLTCIFQRNHNQQNPMSTKIWQAKTEYI